MKRILRYCKGTVNDPLVLNKGKGLELMAYTDSDFCGEPDQSAAPLKSLTGIGFIYAQFSLQYTVSSSTTEAEYIAGTAVQVVLGLCNQLEELGFKQEWSTTIWGDNEA